LENFDHHLGLIAAQNEATDGRPVLSLKNLGLPHTASDGVILTFETIDYAFISLVWPRLREAGLPFTILISPETIDQGLGDVTWAQIKELAANDLVTVGMTACRYDDLRDMTATERDQCLNRAIGRFEEQLGYRPIVAAAPFGMYNADVVQAYRRLGFSVLLGQQAGVWRGTIADDRDEPIAPRFTMTEALSDGDRLTRLLTSRSFAARDLTLPLGNELMIGEDLVLGFGLNPRIVAAGDLSCYATGGVTVVKTVLAPDRVELRLDQPWPLEGRQRLNCVAEKRDPKTGDLVWYWQGFLFGVQDQGQNTTDENAPAATLEPSPDDKMMTSPDQTASTGSATSQRQGAEPVNNIIPPPQ
jgi:peptidoglycan/xylan/chitin deacetylase (PgdA/CDA1 family)